MTLGRNPTRRSRWMRMGVELSPEDVDARVQLASMYMLRNERDDAIAQFQKILEIDTTQYEYLQQLGSLCESEGRVAEAISYL